MLKYFYLLKALTQCFDHSEKCFVREKDQGELIATDELCLALFKSVNYFLIRINGLFLFSVCFFQILLLYWSWISFLISYVTYFDELC